MPNWDRRFLELAKHVSEWSKDPSSKIGAVIVDPETNVVVGMGYNGFPRGVGDDTYRLNTRDLKLHYIVHAEVNAILNANKSVRGCTIYIHPIIMQPPCCSECAKFIVQAGIKRIVSYTPLELSTRWKDQSKFANHMITESGIQCSYIERGEQQGAVAEL